MERHGLTMKWGTVKRKFAKNYGPKRLRPVQAHVKILALRQERNESVLAYTDRFETLVEEAKVARAKKGRAMPLLITSLINGLKDTRARDRLLKKHSKKPCSGVLAK